MTAYNPLPSHMQAMQDDIHAANGGLSTPSYGGTVSTGAEWEFVIGKDGRRR